MKELIAGWRLFWSVCYKPVGVIIGFALGMAVFNAVIEILVAVARAIITSF